MKRGLTHAIAAGQLLIEAKAQLKHGQWLPWLAEHCPASLPERTASFYMRLARHAPELEAKSATVADLTIRGAIQLLAPPAAPKASEPKPCRSEPGQQIISAEARRAAYAAEQPLSDDQLARKPPPKPSPDPLVTAAADRAEARSERTRHQQRAAAAPKPADGARSALFQLVIATENIPQLAACLTAAIRQMPDLISRAEIERVIALLNDVAQRMRTKQVAEPTDDLSLPADGSIPRRGTS
jgi:hypothetical protein